MKSVIKSILSIPLFFCHLTPLIAGLESGDQISGGGQVRNAGQAKYRKGTTVIQAIDVSGGRNVLLLRGDRPSSGGLPASRAKGNRGSLEAG